MSSLRIALICLVVASGHVLADGGEKKASTPAAPMVKQHAAPASSSKPEGKQDFVPGGVAHSFVIPKNTCESGVSIQKLLTDKPPTGKPK